MTRPRQQVHLVVPHGIDDLEHPSGGNTYDRRISGGLSRQGWHVHEHPVAGGWPDPDPWACSALAAGLDELSGLVLLDGLIGCAAPDVLVAEADRLDLVVLLHLPLGVLDAARRPGEKAVLSAAAGVVVPSRWTRDWVLDEYGLPPDRVHVVAPGVDPAHATVGAAAGERLLCVGAMTPLKGHDLLTDALATVADRPWQCTCVGALDVDRHFTGHLRAHVAEMGLAGRLVFAGPISRVHLGQAYGVADLLVLPSRQEAYGMVVTEALARAVPVLAADVGGVREAAGVDDAGRPPALFFTPGDADALADALRAWLGDPALRTSLRERARSRRNTLSGWPETAATLADVLAEVHHEG